MTTLLSIIQDVADELSLDRPGTVIGSDNQTARNLLSLANRQGRDMVRMAPWTILQLTHTFTTSNGTASYALPSDYDRLYDETEWDRANQQPLLGPTDPVEWQTIKSGGIGTGGVYRRFRIKRDSTSTVRKIYIDPTPSVDGDTLAFEYISKNWCATSGGTPAAEWANDTDVPILDADLFRLGIIVRYRRGRGLDFDSEALEYKEMFDVLVGQDRPSKTLNLVSRREPRLLDWNNIPDTGYGS